MRGWWLMASSTSSRPSDRQTRSAAAWTASTLANGRAASMPSTQRRAPQQPASQPRASSLLAALSAPRSGIHFTVEAHPGDAPIGEDAQAHVRDQLAIGDAEDVRGVRLEL